MPDECRESTGGCDPPTDDWSCFDNWDVPGDFYPDDVATAAGVYVKLDAADNVFLDVTAQVQLLSGATLRITQTGAGDLNFSALGPELLTCQLNILVL